MYSRWLRNSFIYLLILVAVIAIVFAFFSSGDDHQKVGYGQVVEDAKNGLVQKIEVDGRNLTVTYVTTSGDAEPEVKSSKIGPNSEIEKLLADAGVAVTAHDPEGMEAAAALMPQVAIAQSIAIAAMPTCCFSRARTPTFCCWRACSPAGSSKSEVANPRPAAI